jgi:WD40 repeat protein
VSVCPSVATDFHRRDAWQAVEKRGLTLRYVEFRQTSDSMGRRLAPSHKGITMKLILNLPGLRASSRVRFHTWNFVLLIGAMSVPLCGCSSEPANTSTPPESAPAGAGPVKTVAGDSKPTETTAPLPRSESGGTGKPAAAESTAAHQAASSDGRPATPAKSPKKAPAPSAEQLAKWQIPATPDLQLLACVDEFHDSFVRCLAAAPDGKRFIAGGTKLTLWNVKDSQPLLDLIASLKEKQIQRPILCADISSDGVFVAAGDSDGTVCIRNLDPDGEPRTLRAHEGHVSHLAISPDSTRLATTSFSGDVRIWQSSDGSKVRSLKVGDQELAGLTFLSDTLLATAGRETAVWNIESGDKVATLSTGLVRSPGLAVDRDRHWLAFADGDEHMKLWDVEKQSVGGPVLHGAGVAAIDFSADGKRLATCSGISSIQIWDLATGNIVQEIAADGGRTTALRWLPGVEALLAATESGRVRIWGTPESARLLELQPLAQPELRPIAATARRSYSTAQFERIVDVHSLPRLPNAIPGWSSDGMTAYNAPASQAEAELFYRYVLERAGWTESDPDPSYPGLNFQKEGCWLSVSIDPASETSGPNSTIRKGDLQIRLQFSSNYDVRWLPKVSEVPSNSTFSSHSLVIYRTRAEVTDVEVSLLKTLREAGWTPYTRLGVSSAREEPDSRTLSLIQAGSELHVSIQPDVTVPGELSVTLGVHMLRNSLPIPSDSSWVEFDKSVELQFVAHTKANLQQTVDFYDREMALDGWMARPAGRQVDEKDGKAWLPFIRGQHDVLIRLESQADDVTRILVGNYDRFSWQLAPPAAAAAPADQPGIEAADFELPKGATDVKYDVDEKQIEFEVAGAQPSKLAEIFVKNMEALGWKQDGFASIDDVYARVAYKKGKAEIQFRARPAEQKSTVQIGGNGLLWTKPLPVAPVRISYETWLRRNHKSASLEHIDEFVEAMRQISKSSNR